MSDDILTELRGRAAAIERQGETDWFYDDVADEIERLRAEIARLRITDADEMSDTATLVAALRILARDIHCEDGVATQCITEAADTIERLRLTDAEREAIATAKAALHTAYLQAEGNGLSGKASRYEQADMTLRGLLERTRNGSVGGCETGQ